MVEVEREALRQNQVVGYLWEKVQRGEAGTKEASQILFAHVFSGVLVSMQTSKQGGEAEIEHLTFKVMPAPEVLGLYIELQSFKMLRPLLLNLNTGDMVLIYHYCWHCYLCLYMWHF